MRAVLARFGSPQRADRGHVAVRLDEGTAELAEVVRALDAEGIAVQDLEIHAPTLDDVFLAKTGRRLEGAGDEAEQRRARHRRARGRARVSAATATARAARSAPAHAGTLTQVGYLARRSITRTVRQPILIIPSLVFPLFLLAVNSSGLDAATSLPGFPTDSYLTFALGLTFMQGALFATMGAGQSIAGDIQHGFFNRLQLTPLRGPALIAGQLAGVDAPGADPGRRLPGRRARLRRRPRGRDRRASWCCSRSRRWSASPSARSGSRSGCGPATARRSRASSRCCSSSSSSAPARCRAT